MFSRFVSYFTISLLPFSVEYAVGSTTTWSKDKGMIPQYCGGAAVLKFDVAHDVNKKGKSKKRMTLVSLMFISSSLVHHFMCEISFVADEAIYICFPYLISLRTT